MFRVTSRIEDEQSQQILNPFTIDLLGNVSTLILFRMYVCLIIQSPHLELNGPKLNLQYLFLSLSFEINVPIRSSSPSIFLLVYKTIILRKYFIKHSIELPTFFKSKNLLESIKN